MSVGTIVALVTDAFGSRGGIAQYNRDLFGALSKYWSLEVLPRYGDAGSEELPAQILQHKSRSSRMAYSVLAAMCVWKRRPHIIFCGHLYMTPLAALLGWLCRAKLVVQLHGIEAWKKPTRLQSWAVSTASAVLCVSRHTRTRAVDWCDLPPERIVVLPNTVRTEFVPGDRQAARAQLGIKDEQVLLSVGRLDKRERYKGYEILIKLIPHFRKQGHNILYLIAGDGDDCPRLQELARNHNVEENVRFLGFITDERLPDLYRAADVFVMPSTGEGFGIVYLEAMACGTIAFGLGEAGARDALGDGSLGVIASKSALGPQLSVTLELARIADPRQLEMAVKERFGQRLFAARAARVFEFLAA
jgi:phosphatidylinositol alpha-1,6-mannosyltransferase